MRDENIARGHLIRKLEKINQRLVQLESMKTELKEVQELLQKERETFFPILHKAPYGIAIIDSDGKFIYINPAFTNITGYTLEDIFAGREWFHTASPFPEYRQEIIGSLKRDVIQKGAEKIFSVVCKNGEIKEIEFKPTLLDDGRIVMILSDITEHKRAEDTLKESEEKYRTILENVEDGYFEVDIAGNFTFFNDSLCRMLGYSKDEMIGMNNRKYTDQGNGKKLYEAFNKVYRTGEPIKGFAWEVIKKDGAKGFGEVSVSLIKDSKGEPIGFRGIARDITDRKRAEEALQESEGRLRTTLASIQTGVIIIDPVTHVIVDVNPTAIKLIGAPREKIVNSKCQKYICPAEIGKCPITDLKQNVDNSERILLTANNEAHPIIKTVVPIMLGGREYLLESFVDITERKRAEEALKSEKQRFHTLSEQAPFGMVVIDKDGIFRYINPKFKELFGYDLTDVPNGKTWFRKAYPDPTHRHQVISDWLNDLERTKSGEKRSRIFRATCKDGTEKIVNFISVQLEGDENLVACEDITERKHAEEEIRHTVSLLNATLESTADGILVVDRVGKIVSFNQKFVQMWHIPKSIMASQDDDRALAFVLDQLKDPEGFLAKVKELYNQSESESLDLIEFKDRRVFERYSQPQWIGEHSIGRVWSFRDVTERKWAEEALRISEGRYRTILENIEEAYFEDDLEGNFTFVNDVLCRLIGYSKEELIGMNYRQYTDEENAAQLRELYVVLYKTGKPIKAFDLEATKKDGTKAIYETSVSLLKDSEGKPIGFRGIARDITERKRAEGEKAALQEELRHSQKMEAIGGLAGGIAHDFNNILTVISGNCQLSLLELKEGDPLRGNIGEIKEAADRATSLTHQLLAFSRRQVLDMKVLNLNRIIRDLEKMLRRLIGEDVGLVTSLADDLGMVKTDPGSIEQVIMNLAVNARDAMPSGGKLIIETDNAELDEPYARSHVAIKPGPYVKLCVNDTGVGMTQEVREHVFEPFFTTKKKGKGTGLGLSTVYGIVKQSGGSIWIDSEPGLGTTFNIYLPRVDETLEEMRKKVKKEEVPGGGETILVVEDEEDVRRLAVRILERQGYTVLEASCGNDALVLSKERKEPIHMVLTDVVMPGMSGPQLTDQLIHLHPKMKVLYMSGYTDNAVLHHGVLEEGVNYIQKPFTIDGLMKKMREVLDKNSSPIV